VEPHKRPLFGDLAGTVVEIGPGTGANLRFLDPARVRFIGTEPVLERYLRPEAARTGVPIELHLGTAEREKSDKGRSVRSPVGSSIMSRDSSAHSASSSHKLEVGNRTGVYMP